MVHLLEFLMNFVPLHFHSLKQIELSLVSPTKLVIVSSINSPAKIEQGSIRRVEPCSYQILERYNLPFCKAMKLIIIVVSVALVTLISMISQISAGQPTSRTIIVYNAWLDFLRTGGTAVMVVGFCGGGQGKDRQSQRQYQQHRQCLFHAFRLLFQLLL